MDIIWFSVWREKKAWGKEMSMSVWKNQYRGWMHIMWINAPQRCAWQNNNNNTTHTHTHTTPHTHTKQQQQHWRWRGKPQPAFFCTKMILVFRYSKSSAGKSGAEAPNGSSTRRDCGRHPGPVSGGQARERWRSSTRGPLGAQILCKWVECCTLQFRFLRRLF